MTKKKYEWIRDQLLEAIGDGSLPAGSKLKSEVTLAKEYGVSVLTVRRAMADLASAGYILRKKKIGTFVTTPVPADLKACCRQRGIAIIHEVADELSIAPAQIANAVGALSNDPSLKGVLILFQPSDAQNN